jgi:hypothetical protein
MGRNSRCFRPSSAPSIGSLLEIPATARRRGKALCAQQIAHLSLRRKFRIVVQESFREKHAVTPGPLIPARELRAISDRQLVARAIE